jgi:hypothetical protein
MKACILATVLLLAARVSAQDHTALVAQVKAEVQAAGIDINHGPGECGRFEITKRVAWLIRQEGWGLIYAGSGNGCSDHNTLDDPKYRVDTVMKIDGSVIDMLCGGGDGNTPCWNPSGNQPSTNWRMPFDPGTTGGGGPPPPEDLTARVVALEREVAALRAAQSATQQQLDNLTAATVQSQIPDLYNRVADHDRRILTLEARPVHMSCSVQFGLRCELR